jgi:hypothetical protein
MDTLNYIAKEDIEITAPLLNSLAEDPCEGVLVISDTEDCRKIIKVNTYEEICDCLDIFEGARKNLDCYQTYMQKNYSIRNVQKATVCIPAVGLLALAFFGGLFVHVAVTKEISTAMATLGPAFAQATERLSTFMKNYTAEIYRLKSTMIAPKALFDRCQPPDTAVYNNDDWRYPERFREEDGFRYYWHTERGSVRAFCSVKFESWETTATPGWICSGSRFRKCENFTHGQFPIDKFCVTKPSYGYGICSFEPEVLCEIYDESAPCFMSGIQEVSVIERSIDAYVAENHAAKTALEQDVNEWQGLINASNANRCWEIPFTLLFATILVGGFLYILYLRRGKEKCLQ